MWKALEAQQLTLCVTTDILLEYEKFADCAIAVSADYLVTNDRHFNPLKKLPFPILKIVNEDEFHTIFKAFLKKKPKND